MKHLVIIMAFMLSLGCGSCSPSDETGTPGTSGGSGGNNAEEPGNNAPVKIKLTIGSVVFTATLADNPAAGSFKGMLPLTLDMSDVNGNEKYIQLGSSLPVSASNPGTIRTGDLMLWGSNGLVLFYKTFTTSYSYTRLGSVDNPSGLESALGTGRVTVRFELSEED